MTKHLLELTSRGLVKSLENGIAFTRAQQSDQPVTIVKQMPTMASGKQPTIAIITAQYCEKLAVDAMIENKETFVRYTTVGKSFSRYLRIICSRIRLKLSFLYTNSWLWTGSAPTSPTGETNTNRRNRFGKIHRLNRQGKPYHCCHCVVTFALSVVTKS